MILARYLSRQFLRSFALTLLALWAILMLADTIEQIRRLSKKGISAGNALYLAALNTPILLYEIFPLIITLAAIIMAVTMARTSELVAIRASGRSGLAALTGPILMALTIGIIGFTVINPLTITTQKEYTRLWNSTTSNTPDSSTLLSEDGLWLREAGPEGSVLIHAARINAAQKALYDVTFVIFSPEGLASRRIQADYATLHPNFWHLGGGVQWSFQKTPTSLKGQILPDNTPLPSRFTWEGISSSIAKASQISFWQLPTHIKQLERAGLSARGHQLQLQRELAQPLLMVALLIGAASLTMRHSRAKGRGTMIMIAVLGGFGMFFLRDFSEVLGQNGEVPVLVAAWAPPTIATLIALTLILHREDG